MNKEIQQKIDTWCSSPFDDETIKEITTLKNAGYEDELADRFYKNLEFGTGGLRGIVAAGTNRMNIYTVGMATQGVADYLKDIGYAEKGVVIARDSRIKSPNFAMEAAVILASNGIPVYYFEHITPVPAASFAIRELNAAAGIVITASHNPPSYNGFKLFWSDGAQIVPPVDKEIINYVEKIKSIDRIVKDEKPDELQKTMFKFIDHEIIDKYISYLEQHIENNPYAEIKTAYSPLHGTGITYIPQIFHHFGYPQIQIEPEQLMPDENFPTVESPNPEEPDTMKRVINLALETGSDIALATDPDCDRIGAGVKSDESYTLLNGNQIGALLEYYTLNKWKNSGKTFDNSYIVKTIVTTDLQKDIAEDFGCRVYEELTGFKWIAARIGENEKKGMQFLYGGEESYGYLLLDGIRDKDAISSCLIFAEMTAMLKSKGGTPLDYLEEIYERYSYYLEDSHSLTLPGIEGLEKTGSIMDHFRNTKIDKIADSRVSCIMDFLADIRHITRSETSEKTGMNLPSSDVIQFFLEDGSKISIRPSGTEPKIKLYFSVKKKRPENQSAKEVLSELKDKISNLKLYFSNEISGFI